MNPADRLSRDARLGAVWLGGMAMAYPLAHTGAWRSLFLFMALAQVGVLWWRYRSRLHWPRPGTEGWLLAMLSLWLVVASAFFSPAPGPTLIELGREWGKLALLAALGIGLVAAICTRDDASCPGASTLTTGIFLGLFIHVPLILGYHGWQFWQTGRLPLGESPLGNYGYVSWPVNGVLALLLADAAGRLCRKGRLLPLSGRAVSAAVVATLLANALLTSKAGLVMTHLLSWTFLAAVLRQGTEYRRMAVLTVVVGLGLATATSLLVENRWIGAVSAFTSGVTAAEAPAATSVPLTIQSPIQRVDGNDPSFYFRSSWARLGLEGLVRHPFGLGYGADAFGRHLEAQYGIKGFVSSHSGWLDFALANGIPGLLLFLGLAGMLMWRGWLAFRNGNAIGLALMLTVLNYAGRCAMDGYLGGARLAGFTVMAATLWALSAPRARDARPA